MCGIFGMIRFDGRPVDVNSFDAMRTAMVHRGPDDYGHFISGSIGIANLRLSIIDLETGHQPMFNEDKSVVVVLNGEIYNYQQLRKELGHHRFQTHSDTESIVHAYEEWGAGFLPKLNGMFALCVWDESRRELLLARDRAGIKPLYYVHTDQHFVFASEIKALHHAGLFAPEVDKDALATYLSLKYIPSEKTMFKNVKRLLPGQRIIVKQGGEAEYDDFWRFRLEPTGTKCSEENYAQELQELLGNAVQKQMIADVPLGAFLSGGLDSGIIVSEMARQRGPGMRTFTIQYDTADASQNEAKNALATAKLVGANHTLVNCSEKQCIELLPLLVYHLDEPISEPLLAPNYLLAKAARKELTVVLTGEGADELFAGYARYKTAYWAHLLQSVPLALREMAYRTAARFFGPQDARTRLLGISADPATVVDWHSVFSGEQIVALTGQGAQEMQWRSEWGSLAGNQSLLDFLLETDSRFRLPEYILTRADKMTMANSLEMRPPLLDNDIIEFALRLPSSLKLHNRKDKYILRRAVEGRVSKEIVNRRKVAFSAPFINWLPELCKRYIQESHAAEAGLLRQEEVNRLIDQHPFYGGRGAEKLWSLIVFEVWYRIFIDRTLSVEPH